MPASFFFQKVVFLIGTYPFVWPDTTKIFVSVTFGTIVFISHAL